MKRLAISRLLKSGLLSKQVFSRFSSYFNELNPHEIHSFELNSRNFHSNVILFEDENNNDDEDERVCSYFFICTNFLTVLSPATVNF